MLVIPTISSKDDVLGWECSSHPVTLSLGSGFVKTRVDGLDQTEKPLAISRYLKDCEMVVLMFLAVNKYIFVKVEFSDTLIKCYARTYYQYKVLHSN
jgi:hypothetical protein